MMSFSYKKTEIQFTSYSSNCVLQAVVVAEHVAVHAA